jgi:hypothetical protein
MGWPLPAKLMSGGNVLNFKIICHIFFYDPRTLGFPIFCLPVLILGEIHLLFTQCTLRVSGETQVLGFSG